MSAYDNPTIIKDDSALIWGQAAGGIAESFTQSFNAARQRRDAEIKEAKLDAEKKAKESKEYLINIQRTNAEIENNNAVDLSRTVAALPKDLGADLTAQFGNQVQEFGKMFGEADTKNQTEVVGEDVKATLALKPTYLKTRQNVITTFGAATSQVNSYMEEFKGDGSDVSINGLTPVQRMTNFYTLQGLNPKNAMSANVTKNFTWDKQDPKKAQLFVSTKFSNEKELKTALLKFSPGAKDEELNTIITKAGKDITKNDDGTYSLNFEKNVGDGSWDGLFYSKVPPVLIGDEFAKANVVDDKNQFSTKYLGNTTTIPAEGYDTRKPGFKGYWQGTEIDIKKAEEDLRPLIQARMEGLLAADFKDPNVLQGFLTNKLHLGVNDASLILTAESYDNKVKLLTDKAMSIEINRISVGKLHKVGDKYYLGDKTQVEGIGKTPDSGGKGGGNGGGGGGGDKDASDLAAIQKRMRNVKPGKVDEFFYKGKSVAWDGKKFIVKSDKSAGKNNAMGSLERAIEYISNL
jgi:hypothetical protein